MRHVLKPHPDFPCSAVSGLEVEAARPGGRTLALRYLVTGRIGELALPAPAEPRRVDELWRRTCFEAFVRPEAGEAYYEFNLAPSTEWAAYGFSGYREGMRSPDGIGDPRISTQTEPDRLVLEAVLDLGALPDLPASEPWRLGLTAVIEAASGEKSYWALAHAPGRPDFHHADCFAARIEAPRSP
jgi:hypothetical protein